MHVDKEGWWLHIIIQPLLSSKYLTFTDIYSFLSHTMVILTLILTLWWSLIIVLLKITWLQNAFWTLPLTSSCTVFILWKFSSWGNWLKIKFDLEDLNTKTLLSSSSVHITVPSSFGNAYYSLNFSVIKFW